MSNEEKGGIRSAEFKNELFRLWPLVTVVILIVGGYIAAGFYYDYKHSQYAIGSEYTITATIDELSKERRGTGGVPSYDYDVVLSTAEELPDGTHRYESDYPADYDALKDFAQGDDVEVVVDSKGYLKKSE